MLIFFAGAGIGILAGGILGKLKGFNWGIGVACLIIAGCGIYATGDAIRETIEKTSGTIKVAGILDHYTEETERTTETNDAGKTVTVDQTYYVPHVRFATSDEQTHMATGRGGGKKWEPGEKVEVAYKPGEPDKAFVNDFQNTWAAPWGISLFAFFPLMAAVYFLGGMIYRRGTREDTWRKTEFSPAETTRNRIFAAAAVVVFLGSIVVAVLTPGNVGGKIGYMFFTIGLGCLVLAVGQWTIKRASWEGKTIPFMVGLFSCEIALGTIILTS